MWDCIYPVEVIIIIIVGIHDHYIFSGVISISGGLTLTVDSNLNGASPQFTLTCISTGGPATTVTWTRDSVTVTEGTETVLDDPVTAQYTHTLTVTGILTGLYTCTVANDRPSSDITQYLLGLCSYLEECMLLNEYIFRYIAVS